MGYCGKVGTLPRKVSEKVSLKKTYLLCWSRPTLGAEQAHVCDAYEHWWSKSECGFEWDFRNFMKNGNLRSLIFFPIYLCFYLRC